MPIRRFLPLRRTALAVSTLVASGLALTMAVRDVSRPAPAAASGVERGPEAPAPTLDLRGTYALTFESRQWADHTARGLGPLETALRLEGHLSVRPLSPGRLLLAFTAVRAVDGTFAGGALHGLDAVFEAAVGHVVVARYDARGVFTGLEVPPGVGEAAQGVFQVLAGVLQRTDEDEPEATVLARFDAAWSETRPGSMLRVRRPAATPAPRHPGAAEIDLPTSGTRFSLDPGGRVVSVSHAERTRLLDAAGAELVLDDSTLELHRLDDATVASGGASGEGRPVGIGEFAPDGRAEADLLRTAAAGLDVEHMTRMIRLHGAVGRVPDLSRFLFRAAALLRLEPTAAAALAGTYVELPPGAPGRGLVLDLLAQVGTEATQEALVGVLRSPAAQDDPRYDVHLQRVGFVPDPSPALVAFARELAANPPAGLEKATAFGLGAVAGQVARRGQSPEALALAEPLREALDEAESPDARVEALRALGNAGLVEHFDALESHADAPEAGVRAAVAAAVRKHDTAEARALLVTLAADADREVALAAFEALNGHALGAPELAALAGLAKDVALAEPVANALLTAVTPYRTGAEGRRILAALATRADFSPATRARLEALGG